VLFLTHTHTHTHTHIYIYILIYEPVNKPKHVTTSKTKILFLVDAPYYSNKIDERITKTPDTAVSIVTLNNNTLPKYSCDRRSFTSTVY